MPRWIDELWFGARFALSGGRDARLRAALTGLGVALGVSLLLLAASVPHMVSAHNARIQARSPVSGDGPTRLLYYADGTSFRGQAVSMAALQTAGRDDLARAPVPPGIPRIPGPGQMFVSPALGRLLRSPIGQELARRLHDRVLGTIGQAGLGSPTELFAYRGASDLNQRGASTVTTFGEPTGGTISNQLVTLLVIAMSVGLILPVAVFVAVAGRFGSEQRNQRLADLRLVGAGRSSTVRIAAGEALLGSLGGLVIGAVLFAALMRPLAAHTHFAGIAVFQSDVQPSVALSVLIAVGVPTVSVLFSLVAMRQVAIEPLGVSRRGLPRRRRLLWRLLTPTLGFALLLPLVGGHVRLTTTIGEVEAAAGVVLVLLGVSALLPWLVDAVVERAGAGPLPWLLAVRRMRMDHGTSGRVVSAVGLTVAGAIALQMVFGAASTESDRAYAASPHGSFQIADAIVPARDPVALMETTLRSVRGVRQAIAVGVDSDEMDAVEVAPCSVLLQTLRVRSCNSRSAYIVRRFGRPLTPGQLITPISHQPSIRVPADARVVAPSAAGQIAYDTIGESPLMLTPGAARLAGVSVNSVAALVSLSGSVPGAQDRLLDAVAGLDPLAAVNSLSSLPVQDSTVQNLQHVLIAGAAAVLLVIGLSLLVSMAEQLRERRRVLAVMAAFGTRRSVLAASVAFQMLLPVALGLVLAIIMGTALGITLLKVVDVSASFDPGAVALLAAIGGAVVAGTTALTMPVLRRQIHPDALRAE